ncbi:hypothetical protein A0128_03230 [Leptospira tipperaryensis]|uniref:Uncharacterized protein n=1 Tax=Leptospira tipperaryensis TaxID=2564040 RepID=A0A1D7UTS7_9LEPT|nr:hypothetical protein A0128_03230 [Leptospira tipperaryensis]
MKIRLKHRSNFKDFFIRFFVLPFDVQLISAHFLNRKGSSNLKINLSEVRQSSVKARAPHPDFGWWRRVGGKTRETFLYQRILLFASKKRLVGTPTKGRNKIFVFLS